MRNRIAITKNALLALLCVAFMIVGQTAANAADPTFAPGVLNPFGILENYDEVGELTFGDLDGDGDLDCISGGFNSNFMYFQNIGTAFEPSYAAPVLNGLGLTPIGGGQIYSAPVLVDIDNDGDLDMFSGMYSSGAFRYYQNTGTPSNPAFAASVTNPFGLTSFPAQSNPAFADLDDDGDLDFLASSFDGTFRYQQNTGTASAPAFAAAVANPFGLTDVGSIGSPAFVDIDLDGDLDLFAGESDASVLKFFRNTGTAAAPAFASQVVNPFGITGPGTYPNPTFADLNRDGRPDLITGDLLGRVRFFRNIAPTITVTNANDSGAGSLRQAVADSEVGGIINFDLPAYPATITLTSGEMTITKTLSIVGPGANLLTVSGNDVSRIFVLPEGSAADMVISDLTMAHARDSSGGGSGGAILNLSSGRLFINRASFVNNQAFSEGGAIITWFGSLEVRNSTFTGNTATFGAAISVKNTRVTIINCTISGNTASGHLGGGIVNFFGNVTIRNSTITANAANGTNGTNAFGSGGGVANALSGTVTLSSTIVAGNTGVSPDVGDNPNNPGTIITEGYNLIGKNEGSASFFPAGNPNANIDIVGTIASQVDPLLGLLADNGGTTLTHALLPGSPAIDKGKAFGSTTDQRGNPRPFDVATIEPASGGDNSDIGAYESENTAPVANGDNYTTNEDTPLTIAAPGLLGNDTDGENDPLTVFSFTQPAVGTGGVAVNANGAFTFTPALDFSGSTSFTYRITDGALQSAFATVSITVNAVNDAPTITTTPLTSATEDTLYSYDADNSDVDGPQAIWSLNSPTHTCGGSINASTGLFTFTPAGPVPPANCVMSIRVRDAGSPEQSAVQSVTIAITAVNDAPTASPDSYSVNEDNALTVAVPGVLGNDSDPEGTALTAALVAGPAHGTFALNANGSFTYTPAANYSGPDSFTYRASDGSLTSGVTTVSITVNAVNDAPTIAAAAGVTRTQGTPAAVSQIATVADIDNNVNTLIVTVNGGSTATVNGVTISGITINTAGQVSASIQAACGSTNASFTLRVTDPGNLFNQATLSITVVRESIPPVINPISNVIATLPNGTATSMAVSFPLPTATDNCSTPMVTTNPVTGSVFQVGTTIVNVTATDANGNVSTATFTVTVQYNFSGFAGRVLNPPAVNTAFAGNTIPITFSLGGDKGLNIFAPNSPSSQQANCSTWAPIGASSPANLAQGLTFFNGTYQFYWQTDAAWAGTCRQLSVALNDGTVKTVKITFYN